MHRRRFDNLAGIHDQDALANTGDHAEVVRNQHQSGIQLTVKPLQQIQYLRLHGDIERGGRFIGEQQAGVAGQRHGDHYPLAHAAAKLVRILLQAGSAIGNPDQP